MTLRTAVDDLLNAERGRLVLWLPVLVGCGVAAYFALPVEPPAMWSAVCLPLLFGLLFWGRYSLWAKPIVIALLALALGFVAADLRTELVSAPMLSRSIGPVMLEATVLSSEDTDGGGARLLLGEIKTERALSAGIPKTIRLTLKGRMAQTPVAIGARIKVLANLMPPMEPSIPDGFDFRQQAYFNQLGALGMALSPPEVIALGEGEGEGLMAERWREIVKRRILTQLSGAEGAIAVAFMTGERGAIDEATNANMRAAGTAHLLSISGMHIGMVAGLVFISLRLLMALWPRLALYHDIKKYAAVAALVTVVAYTWFVGSPIPAQRSALMTGLVFLGVLIDRRVITLRSVALSAAVLMLIFPESLLNIGFQLSFAAMVMLVAAYEFSQQRKVPELEDQSWWAKGWRYVVGVVVTSIIAGLATMPYGAWHFNRLQLLGVLGNLIAVPLTGVVLMPAMLAAYVLMPLGLDAPALWLMGLGLKGVTASAAWVAGLPGASLIVERFSFSAVLFVTFGGLWLCIWQTRLRLVGLVPIALGFVLMFFPVRPDVIVSAEGLAALRTGESYAISRAQGSRIVRENWSRAFAGGAELQALRQVGAQCDALGCVLPVAGQSVAVVQNGEALEEDCRRASLVIAPDAYVSQCSAPVIDARYLRTHGAVTAHWDGVAWSFSPSRTGATRPWQSGYRASYPSSYPEQASYRVQASDRAEPQAERQTSRRAENRRSASRRDP